MSNYIRCCIIVKNFSLPENSSVKISLKEKEDELIGWKTLKFIRFRHE